MLQVESSPKQLEAEIRRIKEYKPSLGKVLDSFSGVLLVRNTIKKELIESGSPEKQPDMARLAAGVPALSELDLAGWFDDVDKDFCRMLDALEKAFPDLDSAVATLRGFVSENAGVTKSSLNRFVRGETAFITELAEELEIDPDAARFLIEQGLKPHFEACAAFMRPHVEKMRWDKGYCPVCGAYPDTTYLKKGHEDYDYLVAHGGQRWLHCSLCAHEWRLRRMTCPYCENEDADSLEYFQAEDMGHERIYVCNKCRRYVTCIDVSELVDVPPGDLLPFELLHMDLIAQQKGYMPMAWSIWNSMEK